MYLFVLHRLACKCTKIYNACRTIVRLIEPLVLRRFRCRCGLCKISDVVGYKFQADNYRLPHWKKSVPFAHANFPEICPGICGRMVSAQCLWQTEFSRKLFSQCLICTYGGMARAGGSKAASAAADQKDRKKMLKFHDEVAVKADLHDTTSSHTTSLRPAYDMNCFL